MIGMVHNKRGEVPTLVGGMPNISGLGGAAGVQIEGPPNWERANVYGTFWDRVAANEYMLPAAGLGAMVHGQGLGAMVHGQGLGATDAALDQMAIALATKPGEASAGDIADAMKLLTSSERDALGVKLIALGVAPDKVAAAKTMNKFGDNKKSFGIWGVLATVSMAASAYHGYKRNDSVGWALWWGLMGTMFPVITPVIGVAQGFGKPKGQLRGALGESMTSFIKQNRTVIDEAIKRVCPNCRINDRERRMWIANDEGLYRMARRAGVRI